MNLIQGDVKVKGKSVLGKAGARPIKDSNGFVVGYSKTREIKISIQNISKSSKNEGLSLIQAIAATAGHEIEHTADENDDIRMNNANFGNMVGNEQERTDRVEKDPEQVGGNIRRESRINNQNGPKKIERSNNDYNIDTTTLR